MHGNYISRIERYENGLFAGVVQVGSGFPHQSQRYVRLLPACYKFLPEASGAALGTLTTMPRDDKVQANFERLAPEHRETAIVVLQGMGHQDVATQLRAADMSYEFTEYDNWDGGTYVFDIHLHVDARELVSYSEAVCSHISEALNKVVTAVQGVLLGKVSPVPKPVTSRLATNQALDPTKKKQEHHNRHHMQFRSQAEAQMFDSLAEKQRELPRGDTILIVPLPSVWTGEYRWEPDFIVTYRGRVGVIEIDDPTHFKRYASDKSRDQVLEECGVHVVRRIAVEDAANEGQRKQFIDIFLQRLTR